jgi:hypothetical protein
MKRLAAICLLAASNGTFGQPAPIPAAWIGAWAASDGENLDISATLNRLVIVVNSQTELALNLDGSETVSPEGPRLSFHRIDDRTFDLTLSVNEYALGKQVENIRFALSTDGNSLRETQNRTSRVFQKLLFIPPAGRTLSRPIDQ